MMRMTALQIRLHRKIQIFFCDIETNDTAGSIPYVSPTSHIIRIGVVMQFYHSVACRRLIDHRTRHMKGFHFTTSESQII